MKQYIPSKTYKHIHHGGLNSSKVSAWGKRVMWPTFDNYRIYNHTNYNSSSLISVHPVISEWHLKTVGN